MDGNLSERIAAITSAPDADDLGCDLSDQGDHLGAELCFRRALELGSDVARFNLGNELAAQDSLTEAVAELERAGLEGEPSAWLNLGLALERLGDLAGARRAYEHAIDADDAKGSILLAWWHREQGNADEALRLMASAAAVGDRHATGVLACWRWEDSLDPALEGDLRAGADHYPSARTALGYLLRSTGRIDEARATLEQGAKLGELVCFLPLGNLYDEDLNDPAAAEDAYRQGIAAGDTLSHNNLGNLLCELDRLDEAKEHYRLGAEAGDALAAKHLRELND